MSNMPDMKGKVCLVTGATDGVGKVTARELARMGATVIGVGRNAEKSARAQAEIRAAARHDDVHFLLADLAVQAEVRRLAGEVLARWPRLDVLVNNAGALFTSYQETPDGIERTFALNHLAYFLLTVLLLDRLKASAPARIVNVASDAHGGGAMDFDDLNNRAHYSGWNAYNDSKLANILFTYELARRLEGSGVTANAVHPGFVHTNFAAAAGLNMRGPLTPDEGADTQIWLASAPELDGVSGKYFVSRRELRSSEASYSVEDARRLWAVSAALTGIVE